MTSFSIIIWLQQGNDN